MHALSARLHALSGLGAKLYHAPTLASIMYLPLSLLVSHKQRNRSPFPFCSIFFFFEVCPRPFGDICSPLSLLFIHSLFNHVLAGARVVVGVVTNPPERRPFLNTKITVP